MVTSSVAIAGVLLVFCYLIVPSVAAMLYADTIGKRLAIGWSMGTRRVGARRLPVAQARSADRRHDCVHVRPRDSMARVRSSTPPSLAILMALANGVSSDATMQCRNCGTEIADKALICYRCGTPTTEAKFYGRPRRRWVGAAGWRSSGLIVVAVLVLRVGSCLHSPVTGLPLRRTS